MSRLVWMALGGCTSGVAIEPDPPDPTEVEIEIEVEIGTGAGAFESVEDGVELVAGPQGGWHVDVALRTTGIDPEGATLVWQGFDAETEEAVTFVTAARLSSRSVLETPDGWERVGDRIVLEDVLPDEIVGRGLRVTASLSVGDEPVEAELVAEVVDREP